MMNLAKRYKAWRNPPEAKLRALRSDLKRLESDVLRALKKSESDPFGALIDFFNATSPWHDNNRLSAVISAFAEVNDGQYDVIAKELFALSLQITRTGRHPDGWNRSKPGEVVTAENVWLGNIHGLWTYTVSDWQKRSRDETLDSSPRSPKVYDLIANQARGFVRNHASVMAERARALAAR